MKSTAVKVFLLLLILLLLVGCWDYAEIDRLEFVYGLGVDYEESDFVVVAEMIMAGQGSDEQEFEPVILSTRADSLSSADRAMSNPAGMGVFYPHVQVFLVSEEVARAGVLPAIEHIVRGRDVRSTIPFLVTKDCTVEDVFNSEPPFVNSVGEHLNGLVQIHGIIPVFYPQQLWEFTKDLLAIGISGTAPTVQLVHESGDLVPIVKGTAVFKLDRMVGWLNGEESDILALLKGLPQTGRFVMDTKIGEETYPITYEIAGNAVEMSPEVDGDSVTMKVGLELEFDIAEVGTAEISFHDSSIVSSMEEQLAHTFNRRTRELIGKIQREYNSDILGFGQMIRRQEPNMWRKHSEDWDTHLGRLNVDVEVLSRIVLTGVRPEPLVPRN